LPFSIATVASVIYAAGSVGAAFALGWATDEVLVPLYDGAPTRHWAAVALLIGIMVVRSVGVIARRYFAGMTAARARRDLQQDLTDRTVSVSLDRLRARPQGELLAAVDADVEAAIDVIHPTPFAVGVLSMLGFAIASLAAIDIPLTIATVAVLPFVLLTSWFSAVKLEPPTDRERDANAEVTAAAAEIIAGTQVIKTLGREDAELARFATVADRHRQRRVHIAVLKLLINTVFSALPQLAMILILVIGSIRVESGALQPGQLVQAVALFGVLAFPMQVIGFFLTNLPVSVVGRRRIDTIREEPTDPLRQGTSDHQSLPSGALGAELIDVTVGDADRPRLAGLNLAISPGETLAIVGPTAGGKSTVLDVLARLRPIEAGSMQIAGIESTRIADSDLRRRVTVAGQTALLFSGSLAENVDFDRGVSQSHVSTALELAGASELQTELPDGYDTVVGEKGVSLSGGQRQRVALARALAGQPGMILLDDATSAIDPVLEESIITSLSSITTTVVMVTHRVAAMAAADRVAFVAEGQVKAVAPHEQLLEIGEYRTLVEAYQAEESAEANS